MAKILSGVEMNDNRFPKVGEIWGWEFDNEIRSHWLCVSSDGYDYTCLNLNEGTFSTFNWIEDEEQKVCSPRLLEILFN